MDGRRLKAALVTERCAPWRVGVEGVAYLAGVPFGVAGCVASYPVLRRRRGVALVTVRYSLVRRTTGMDHGRSYPAAVALPGIDF